MPHSQQTCEHAHAHTFINYTLVSSNGGMKKGHEPTRFTASLHHCKRNHVVIEGSVGSPLNATGSLHTTNLACNQYRPHPLAQQLITHAYWGRRDCMITEFIIKDRTWQGLLRQPWCVQVHSAPHRQLQYYLPAASTLSGPSADHPLTRSSTLQPVSQSVSRQTRTQASQTAIIDHISNWFTADKATQKKLVQLAMLLLYLLCPQLQLHWQQMCRTLWHMRVIDVKTAPHSLTCYTFDGRRCGWCLRCIGGGGGGASMPSM